MKTGLVSFVGCFSVLFASSAVFAEDVKVSSFGYDPEDSTRFIEQALTSGATRVILDRQAGPWYTLPLRMRSGVTFELEPGVELVAKRGAFKGLRDFLFLVEGVTNAVIRGGAGSAFRMWKKDYQGPDYDHGEWRYALKITKSAHILVEDLRLCDSGGDGIGVSGSDITIRRCVCDNNHRQGISVFNVDGLLIEDTVMSNTSGTPPAAGIDFEPDRNGWLLSNIVMRNCRFENNDGNGIELYLDKIRADSTPVSFLFENCRTVGNRTSVSINPGARAGDHVKGSVRFVNCTFESPVKSGISLLNKTADAFGVSFADCVVSNASPSVSFSVAGVEPIPPSDGIAFERLTVYAQAATNWFRLGRQGFGPLATNVSGSVSVIAADGSRTEETIDAAWIARNLPAFNGGVSPLPRVDAPRFADVEPQDVHPGELVPLTPVSLMGRHRAYLFLVEKKGPVTFVARQMTPVKGRKLSVEPLTVQFLKDDGTLGKAQRLPQAGNESTTIVFKAPRPGFYLLTLKKSKTRFILEKSSVPVALYLSQGQARLGAVGRKPFSLTFGVRSGERFQLMPAGNDYARFSYRLTDPTGKVRETRTNVRELLLFESETAGAAGFWRVDFDKSVEPTYDTVDVDLRGVPGTLFLSDEKRWR